jgi:hypothetical protein
MMVIMAQRSDKSTRQKAAVNRLQLYLVVTKKAGYGNDARHMCAISSRMFVEHNIGRISSNMRAADTSMEKHLPTPIDS